MGEKKVVLETSSHQTAAIRFYNKTGWTEVKTITDKNICVGLIICGSRWSLSNIIDLVLICAISRATDLTTTALSLALKLSVFIRISE